MYATPLRKSKRKHTLSSLFHLHFRALAAVLKLVHCLPYNCPPASFVLSAPPSGASMRISIVALVAFASACNGTAPVQVEQQPRPDSVLEVVVANQGSRSASVLDDPGITMRHVSVGEGPHEAAVSPNGRIAVVTIYGAQTPGNRLSVIDLVGDTVVRTIDLGTYTRPHGAVFLAGSSDRVAV